jgi:hypothetical protein
MVSLLDHMLDTQQNWLLGFENGSPDGNDPLQLARLMASRGITLVGMLLIYGACY